MQDEIPLVKVDRPNISNKEVEEIIEEYEREIDVRNETIPERETEIASADSEDSDLLS